VEILCAGWRCGGSKLCLFSVIMPSKCVSSVSPRFHYRRLAFCFLPLAAIVESSSEFFNSNHSPSDSQFLGFVWDFYIRLVLSVNSCLSNHWLLDSHLSSSIFLIFIRMLLSGHIQCVCQLSYFAVSNQSSSFLTHQKLS
jgi:hypothetical protein